MCLPRFITGLVSISAVTSGGAFGTSDLGGLPTSGDRSSFLGGGQIGADYQFAPELGAGYRRPVLLGDISRTGTLGTLTVRDKTDGLGSCDRPPGLHLGSGSALREGRRRLP